MSPEEKLAACERALRTIEREFLGEKAGLLRDYLIAARMNWVCSRILPTYATHTHLVRKFRIMERAARDLAELYEACPSQPRNETSAEEARNLAATDEVDETKKAG